ncbi:hypothetical protein B0H66DRAFT_602488 [Apodospora peruviana]|uniref:Uncharacterized protein n=1 Tax=Apodospora peruviana TaxID=516989 RepID=A0AAE0M8Q7_9PEZI|nr:hypothetical protein B0H66DRAFT_602488 [Apodospora peruviana]
MKFSLSTLTILVATVATQGASAFRYRFYLNTNCNHSAAASSTSPPINEGPYSGDVGGCYSAPMGTNWQRLEIDNNFAGSSNNVITFCDAGCQGSGTSLQKNTYCYINFPGCAIGSFKVV